MVISASLQACGVVFPFAMLTSICRSIVTICSALYLLIGMTSFSSKWILSHSTWYKNPRSRHKMHLRSRSQSSKVHTMRVSRLKYALYVTLLGSLCAVAQNGPLSLDRFSQRQRLYMLDESG